MYEKSQSISTGIEIIKKDGTHETYKNEYLNQPIPYFIGCDITSNDKERGSICIMKRFPDGQTEIIETTTLKSCIKKQNELKYKLLIKKYFRKSANVTVLNEIDNYSNQMQMRRERFKEIK